MRRAFAPTRPASARCAKSPSRRRISTRQRPEAALAEALAFARQPGHFVRVALTAQHGITMRKATETRNEVAVLNGRVQGAAECVVQLSRRLLDQPPKRCHRFLLHAE